MPAGLPVAGVVLTQHENAYVALASKLRLEYVAYAPPGTVEIARRIHPARNSDRNAQTTTTAMMPARRPATPPAPDYSFVQPFRPNVFLHGPRHQVPNRTAPTAPALSDRSMIYPLPASPAARSRSARSAGSEPITSPTGSPGRFATTIFASLAISYGSRHFISSRPSSAPDQHIDSVSDPYSSRICLTVSTV